jgi:hypothetical protein
MTKCLYFSLICPRFLELGFVIDSQAPEANWSLDVTKETEDEYILCNEKKNIVTGRIKRYKIMRIQSTQSGQWNNRHFKEITNSVLVI